MTLQVWVPVYLEFLGCHLWSDYTGEVTHLLRPLSAKRQRICVLLFLQHADLVAHLFLLSAMAPFLLMFSRGGERRGREVVLSVVLLFQNVICCFC